MPDTEEITLHTAGSIPGIPGSHGPGRYLVDWIERTITRIEEAITGEPDTPSDPEPAPADAAPDAAPATKKKQK